MQPFMAYVGSRTTRERNARGNGLNVYRVDGRGGWRHQQLVPDLINPSFLTFDLTSRFLYCVHGDGDEVSGFALGTEGSLSVLGRWPTGGLNPVHLAVSPDNAFLVVANHIGSSVALLTRAADGRLSEPVDIVALEGSAGPHRQEQPFAKPHQVQFDPAGRFVLVPDKGLDRIFTFAVDSSRRKLLPVGEGAVAREGAGPRHIAFHPGGRHAYVVNELDSTVVAYSYDPLAGRLDAFQFRSSLPDSFTGNSRAAAIAVSRDGSRLFVSNRGSDTLGLIALTGEGAMAAQSWSPAGGRTPRFFCLEPDGGAVLIANEDSDTIMRLALSKEGDAATAGCVANVGSPVCIATLPLAPP